MSSIGNGTRRRFDHILTKDLTIEPLDGEDPVLEVDRTTHKLIIRNVEFTGTVTGSTDAKLQTQVDNLTTTVTNHTTTAAIHRDYEAGTATQNILTSGRIAGDYFTPNATDNNTLITANKPGTLTGARNTVVGKADSTRALAAADDNVLIGHNSGQLIDTGDGNICIGSNAGDAITTGSNNILVDADVSTGTDSNIVNIGGLYKGVRASYCLSDYPWRCNNGSVSAPTYSFYNETNSGLYRKSSNNIAIAVNGVDRVEVGTSSVDFSLPISASNIITGAANLGATGSSVYSTTTSNALQFRKFIAAGNISITENTNDITISTIASVGESNSASNLGAGEGWFASKSGVDLRFKTIVAGTNISLSSDANTITINNSYSTPTGFTAADGSQTAPAYSFTNDTKMGIYRASAGVMGLAVLGGLCCTWDNYTMQLNTQLANPLQPAVIYRATSTQTIANNTLTKVAWQSLELTQGSVFSFASNEFSMVANSIYDGWYLIAYQTSWDGGIAGSYREAFIHKNGTKMHSTRSINPSIAAGVGTTNVSASVAYLTATDVLSLQVQQNSGGNLDILNTSNNSYISICRLF